jgi:hypothetical protein
MTTTKLTDTIINITLDPTLNGEERYHEIIKWIELFKKSWEITAVEQYKEDCKPNIQLVEHPFKNIKTDEQNKE